MPPFVISNDDVPLIAFNELDLNVPCQAQSNRGGVVNLVLDPIEDSTSPQPALPSSFGGAVRTTTGDERKGGGDPSKESCSGHTDPEHR
jgi:hypothetical protein